MGRGCNGFADGGEESQRQLAAGLRPGAPPVLVWAPRRIRSSLRSSICAPCTLKYESSGNFFALFREAVPTKPCFQGCHELMNSRKEGQIQIVHSLDMASPR